MTNCPDCWAEPGQPHTPGCDVERCKNCGWQALCCGCPLDTPATIWTGTWPGDVEVWEYGLRDLNELALACAQGQFTWDREQERWIKSQ